MGYGLYSPNTFLAGIISSFEAFVGLVAFALVTGLLYGRFSKPKANIKFSKNILLSNYQGGKALMFRVMNRRKSMVVLPKVKMSISISEQNSSGEFKNSFYALSMERDQITYLPTTWTIVHPINEKSPLYNYKDKDLTKLRAEVLILLSYHDDSFNEVLHKAHSYTTNDLQLNRRFVKAFKFNELGEVLLNHDLIDETEIDVT